MLYRQPLLVNRAGISHREICRDMGHLITRTWDRGHVIYGIWDSVDGSCNTLNILMEDNWCQLICLKFARTPFAYRISHSGEVSLIKLCDLVLLGVSVLSGVWLFLDGFRWVFGSFMLGLGVLRCFWMFSQVFGVPLWFLVFLAIFRCSLKVLGVLKILGVVPSWVVV